MADRHICTQGFCMTFSSQELNTTANGNADRMQELLLGLVRSLIDNPEALRLETDLGEAGMTFRLYVDAADLGKVIGKQGRTARALRTLLSAVAGKSNQRFALDILEAE